VIAHCGAWEAWKFPDGWYPPDGPIRRVCSAAQVNEAEVAMLAAKAARLMTVDVEVDFFPDFAAFI
jgi:hypothetical protein